MNLIIEIKKYSKFSKTMNLIDKEQMLKEATSYCKNNSH
jgi:hypothetical protein